MWAVTCVPLLVVFRYAEHIYKRTHSLLLLQSVISRFVVLCIAALSVPLKKRERQDIKFEQQTEKRRKRQKVAAWEADAPEKTREEESDRKLQPERQTPLKRRVKRRETWYQSLNGRRRREERDRKLQFERQTPLKRRGERQEVAA